MGLSIEEYNSLFQEKDGKIIPRRRSAVGQNVDKAKVLSEQQILSSLGIPAGEAIFIRGEVPSSKRGWRIFSKPVSSSKWKLNGRPVVPTVNPSEQTERYRKSVGSEYRKRVMDWKRIIAGRPLPLYIEFILIRATKRMFDFNNITEVVQDEMERNGWVENDDVANMFPVPPPAPGYLVDKNNAGVIIKLSNIYDNNTPHLKFRNTDKS